MHKWLISATRAYAQAGNRKSPSYAQVFERFSEIWAELDPSLIVISIDQCGIASDNMTALGSMIHGSQ